MLSIKATHQQGAKWRLRPTAGGAARWAPAAPRLCRPRGSAGGRWGTAAPGPKAGALVTDAPVPGPVRNTKQRTCRPLGHGSAAAGQRVWGPSPELHSSRPLPAHPWGPLQLEAQRHPVPPSRVLRPLKCHLPVPRHTRGWAQPPARAARVLAAPARAAACCLQGCAGAPGAPLLPRPSARPPWGGEGGQEHRRAGARVADGLDGAPGAGARSPAPLAPSSVLFPNPPACRRPGPAGLRQGPGAGPDPGPRARRRSWAAALARTRAEESAQGRQGRIYP